MIDIKILNGTVFDGKGGTPYKGDIGIHKGKIVALGDLGDLVARQTIDAYSKAVCPGFIDMHSHSDFLLPVHNQAYASLTQGITTVVTGNCGQTLAPTRDAAAYLERMTKPYDLPVPNVTWETFAEYLDVIEKGGVGVNIAPLAAHGSIRKYVLGEEGSGGERTNIAPEELEALKAEVAKAMEAGAFGLSTGLEYPPGRNADPRELIELCKVVASYGGIYATHMRSEGQAPRTELFGAVVEAIEVGRQANLPVNISHLKADQRSIWWKLPVVHRMINQARAEGLDVTVDVYPYRHAAAGYLYEVFPAALYSEGLDVLLSKLSDPDFRSMTAEQLARGVHGWTNPATTFGWGSIGIIDSSCVEAVGLSVEDVALAIGVDPLTACFELLLEDKGLTLLGMAARCEDNIRASLNQPFTMISTDSASVDMLPVAGRNESLPPLKLHPRNLGTYPRILGQYVREEQVLSMEEAIYKSTGLPAKTLGLKDRGCITLGMAADLLVFCPETIAEKATYADPHQYSKGIDYVLVNGQIALHAGALTGVKNGKVVRHKK